MKKVILLLVLLACAAATSAFAACPHVGEPTLTFGTNYGECGTAANGAVVSSGNDCGFRVTLGSDYNASETASCTVQPCGCVVHFIVSFTHTPVCVTNVELDGTTVSGETTNTLPTASTVDIDAAHAIYAQIPGGVTIGVDCRPAPN
jgi:hypothetical protein